MVISDARLESVLGSEGYTAYVAYCTVNGLALAETFGEAEAMPVTALSTAAPGFTPTVGDVAAFCTDHGLTDPHIAVSVANSAKRRSKQRVVEERPRLWAAADLHPSQQREWLATGFVPKAAVTLLVGDEGVGKSLLWVWLARHVTTGKPAPEYGIPARDPADVIVVATEDGWSDTVRPRLEVAGVDLDHVHVIATEADGSGSPTFPDHMDLLENAAVTPALIVVDAWLDTVPAGLSVRDPQQARQALHPWKELATTKGAAVLLLTHTNRVATANARDKYGATAELRKKARMTLFAQADPENAECMIVGPEKSNIARTREASRFRITAVQHFPPTDEDDGMVPLLAYAGSAGKSSRELIAETFHGDGDDSSATTEAVAWLTDYLSTGSVPSKTAKDDAAKKAGITERTLVRASKVIGVVSTSEGFPRTTSWALPGTQLDPLGDPSMAAK